MARICIGLAWSRHCQGIEACTDSLIDRKALIYAESTTAVQLRESDQTIYVDCH